MNNPPSIVEQLALAEKEARAATRALMLQTFEIAFETILEQISNGAPLDRIVREYHTPMPLAALRTWIYQDPKRKNAYLVAKAIGAEAVEDELIRISDGVRADGSASLDDVQRSALRIKTRQWLLEKWNRKRYGDVKHIDTTSRSTTTVDVSSLSTDDLKRLIMREAGLDAQDADSLDEFVMAGDLPTLDPTDT